MRQPPCTRPYFPFNFRTKGMRKTPRDLENQGHRKQGTGFQAVPVYPFILHKSAASNTMADDRKKDQNINPDISPVVQLFLFL